MPTRDSMDAALRSVLSPGGQAAPGCDAERAAAYVENRLGKNERQSFEAHMADCAGCRALAAALVEELAPEALQPARRPVWRWRWAAPALAGVVLVGSVVFYQREKALEQKSVAGIPAEPLRAPAESKQTADQERVFSLKPRVATRPVINAAPPQVAQAPPPVPLPAAAAPQAEPPVALAARDEIRSDKNKEAVAIAALETTKEKPAEEGAPAAKPIGQRAEQREVARKMADASEVSATSSASYLAPTPTGLVKAKLALSPLPDAAPVLDTAVDATRVWAVSTAGRIFESRDAGRTWTRVSSPTKADLVKIRWDAPASLLVVEDRQGNQYRVKP